MNKLSMTEYKKLKAQKQLIKSIPGKETDKPLLRSTVKMKVDPYGFGCPLYFTETILLKSAINNRIIK